ncbi:MAG: type II toxin-antitoxin system RelE/ParE family toxin [Thermoplasmata archaeon]|nr:type II toxin-antitoxin system RelE/ParE family toxin [Thermoplasmata archaeon]
MPESPRSDYLQLIDFSDEARRELLSLPPDVRDSFFSAFPLLASNPRGGAGKIDAQNFHDSKGRPTRYWRLKVPGGYRAIYRIVQGRIQVDAIRPRPGVYGWLAKVLARRG